MIGLCGLFHRNDWPCARCSWLSAIGRFVTTVHSYNEVNMGDQWADYHDGLDAIAHLLIAHATTRRTYMREMNEEIRAAQSAAHEAYEHGVEAGREISYEQ